MPGHIVERRFALPADHRQRVRSAQARLLCRTLAAARQRTAVLHRQAISPLGSEIRVAAADRNCIVQAVKHARLSFVVGVRRHPEYLPRLPEQRARFDALVSEAQRRRTAAAAPVEQLP